MIMINYNKILTKILMFYDDMEGLPYEDVREYQEQFEDELFDKYGIEVDLSDDIQFIDDLK